MVAASPANSKGSINKNQRIQSVSQKNVLAQIELNELSSGPVYAQVRNQLENMIKGKEVASGDPLPSPAQIAQKLSVDRGEIQRAYYELEQYGLIRKTTGRGFLDSVTTTYLVS